VFGTVKKKSRNRIIKPIAAKLGMPWMGWHVFRHTHSTLAEELGMALSDRQVSYGDPLYPLRPESQAANSRFDADRLTGNKAKKGH
jgi:hypothetical protein